MLPKRQKKNISSMHQDILNKKKTEIDAINGAIVKYGEEFGIPTPVNKTLTGLIKLIEQKKSGGKKMDKPLTIPEIISSKSKNKLTMLTAYDYPTASLLTDAE